MEIERIPGRLLYKHDCVIVPGFGGFVANPKGATVHPGRHTFNPPYKSILFNRSLTANDGLLVNEVAKELKLSYSESLQAISTFVREAQATLRERQRLILPELGYLQVDIEGNVLFVQDAEVNFLLDAFGLDEFQSLPVVKTERPVVQRTTVKVDRKPLPITRARKRTNNKRVVFAGVVLALLLGAMSFFVNMGINGKFDMASFTFNNDRSNVPATPWPENNIPEINLRSTVIVDSLATDSAAVVTPEEPVKVAPVEPAPVVIKGSGKQFYVVAGCFEEYNNAQKYVGILKGDGITASIADKNNTRLYKVYLASFDKMSDAKNYVTTAWRLFSGYRLDLYREIKHITI
ncbi:MAG: SPOR domain-containing protein [Sphingobacteriales bacterium JAD_PAG50586_3]|nr:MAG: SPOR domain-containing protein [Sphingobacteriales bacterium JAD_PAG50586_3]